MCNQGAKVNVRTRIRFLEYKEQKGGKKNQNKTNWNMSKLAKVALQCK